MYRFPNSFTYDEKADKICREHINNNLLRMVNRHIGKTYDKNGNKIDFVGEEAMRFFPEEQWSWDDNSEGRLIINDKFITLREILKSDNDITPELLLEYVIAKMCKLEVHYTRTAVMEAMVNVVYDDKLQYKIYEMVDRYGNDSKGKLPYNNENIFVKSNEKLNGWNNSEDQEISIYHNNIRLMIKEMLDKVNKKRSKNTYTKKEALKLLSMISDGVFDDDFASNTLVEDEAPENEFLFKMYVKKFGNPCVYKIPDKDRNYVIEKIREEAMDVLDIEVGKEIKQIEVDEYVTEKLNDIEDTRTYEGSEHIFWDWDYTIIDELGVDFAIDFVSNVLGDGPSVGGIRF